MVPNEFYLFEYSRVETTGENNMGAGFMFQAQGEFLGVTRNKDGNG